MTSALFGFGNRKIQLVIHPRLLRMGRTSFRKNGTFTSRRPLLLALGRRQKSMQTAPSINSAAIYRATGTDLILNRN